MLKGLVKRLFGGGSHVQSPEGFFLNARCTACGEVFNLFINKSTDLLQNFEDQGTAGYSLKKEIIGGGCQNRIIVNMEFDRSKKVVSEKIEHVSFI